jgi:hypothetical protein
MQGLPVQTVGRTVMRVNFMAILGIIELNAHPPIHEGCASWLLAFGSLVAWGMPV